MQLRPRIWSRRRFEKVCLVAVFVAFIVPPRPASAHWPALAGCALGALAGESFLGAALLCVILGALAEGGMHKAFGATVADYWQGERSKHMALIHQVGEQRAKILVISELAGISPDEVEDLLAHQEVTPVGYGEEVHHSDLHHATELP